MCNKFHCWMNGEWQMAKCEIFFFFYDKRYSLILRCDAVMVEARERKKKSKKKTLHRLNSGRKINVLQMIIIIMGQMWMFCCWKSIICLMKQIQMKYAADQSNANSLNKNDTTIILLFLEDSFAFVPLTTRRSNWWQNQCIPSNYVWSIVC